MPSNALATWREELKQGLRALEARGLRRSLAEIHGVNFCSNDYLGLAEHPKLHEAAIDAVTHACKVGGTASRLRLSLTCRIPQEELDRLVGSLAAWRVQHSVLTTARRA
jgi:7-keto-8-aminopelargonate synthetase-like enzyme